MTNRIIDTPEQLWKEPDGTVFVTNNGRWYQLSDTFHGYRLCVGFGSETDMDLEYLSYPVTVVKV
jgi:hypothetical protein